MPLTPYTAAEMLVTERRRLERPLLVLVWLSVCAFSLAEGQPFYIFLGTLGAGLNLWAVQCRKEIHLSRSLVNAAVAFLLVILVIEVWGAWAPRSGLLGPLGHFVILIQLCKLFERKTNRDYAQLLALSSLLIVAASLLNQDIWLVGLSVVFLALLCYTAMVLTLKRGLDHAASARLETENSPMAPARVAWNVARDWPARALKRNVATVLAFALFCGAMTFLISPRLEANYRAGNARSGLSGFSDTITLGRPGQIYLSDEVVMRVAIHGAGDVPAESLFYLRGTTFHSYSSGRWTQRTDLPQAPPLVMLTEPPPGPLITHEVAMAASLGSDVFCPYPTISVDTRRRALQTGWDWRYAFASRWSRDAIVGYRTRCLPQPLTPQMVEYLRPITSRVSPPLDGRDGVEVSEPVERLARQWCADLLDQRQAAPERRDKLDLAIAERLAARLKAHATYSLDLASADPGRDAIEDFLFHMRRGHCEYFASALTVMCRALDVQARLAAGFHIDPSRREADGSYIVRGMDAHAWTEVYTPGTDWVILDATPPGRPEAPRQGLLTALGRWWDSVRQWWHDNVVGYDSVSQRGLLRRIGEFFSWLKEGAADVLGSLRESLLNLLIRGEVDRVMVHLSLVLCGIGMVLEAVLLVRLFRRQRVRRRLGLPQARHLLFMEHLLRVLDRAGLKAEPTRTVRQWACDAARRLQLDEGLLRSLVDFYYSLRWGRAIPTDAQLAEATNGVGRIEQALGRRTGSSPS